MSIFPKMWREVPFENAMVAFRSKTFTLLHPYSNIVSGVAKHAICIVNEVNNCSSFRSPLLQSINRVPMQDLNGCNIIVVNKNGQNYIIRIL